MRSRFASASPRYLHCVERVDEELGRVCVSLVRRGERDTVAHLRHHTEIFNRTVIFSRSFRAVVDQVAIADYAAHLSLVARYADAGTFGCFAETRSADGNVDVLLYERWFDGGEIHTDELARHAFDASDEASLITSAEFLADVRVLAEQRNLEREATYRQELVTDQARRRLTSDREAAGRQLSAILSAHTGAHRAQSGGSETAALKADAKPHQAR